MSNRYQKSRELATQAARHDAWVEAETTDPARQNYQFINNHYPLFATHAEGAYLWDIDGNRYIDYTLGYGTVLLGHAHPAVTRAVQEEVARGPCLSPLWKPMQAELCEMICRHAPNGERAFLMKTGSDATTGAVRLARLFTGRKRVLRWGYNGWHDWSTPRPGGVPEETQALVHSFNYNDVSSVEQLLNRYRGEVACVFMMPFDVEPPEPGYLQAVRDLAHAHGALVILDEMRSGFRFGMGGAQAFLDVKADLVTYSKAIANGFAISCIAGRADVLKGLSGTKMTATYFAASEAMAAALSCLRTVEAERVPEKVWMLGERLLTGLSAAVEAEGGLASVYGYPPCPHLEFDCMDADANQRAKVHFFTETARAGLFLHPSHHWYVSAAHTIEDIDKTISIFRSAMRETARHL